MAKFGAPIRKDFLFAEDYINLNHGSFGTFPRVVRDEMRRVQDATEARPDVFIRYDYPERLNKSRAAVSKLLNVDVDEVVFVPNATTGINTVLRNLVFKEGDVIIYFATIYGACEKTVSYITETTPAEAFKIQYSYPVSDSSLLSSFEDAIRTIRQQGKNPRIAIYDTVVSLPGVRVPYEQLTAICKREKVLSCIDAAHAIGMLSARELDLSKLQPDFFVSNCHKWLYVPRGCAVFYVALRNQHLIRSTLPTSHGFVAELKPGVLPAINPLPPNTKPAYIANFEFAGTIDNAPYLCVSTAIQYREDCFGGEEAIVNYLKGLARRGGDLVAQTLGTEVMDNDDGTLRNCAFANVRLPLDSLALARLVPDKSFDAVGGLVRDWIAQLLVKEYNTFVAFIFYGGAWWARLSAQTYLEVSDFVEAGKILKKACERASKGEFL